MGLVKANVTYSEALEQVKHYKALVFQVNYKDTEASQRQKKENTALLFRAMMVLDTIKIDTLQKGIEDEKAS